MKSMKGTTTMSKPSMTERDSLIADRILAALLRARIEAKAGVEGAAVKAKRLREEFDEFTEQFA